MTATLEKSIEKIKLNLGSRDRSLKGFKNMDIDQHPNVDFVGDVKDLSRFQDGSISEIYASHILEHFPHVETFSVLKEWFRVLSSDGILFLAVPDFKRIVEIYTKHGMSQLTVNILYGDQIYKTAYHYTCFDVWSLTEMLKKVGFKSISQVDQFNMGANDCSTLCSNMDGRSISLNLVAEK